MSKSESPVQKFEWISSFETGIEKIDTQHKNLFAKIDALALSIYEGKSSDELIDMMNFLQTYIDEHFHDEEKMMFANEFPEYYDHRDAHRGFSRLYDRFRADYRTRGADLYLAIQVEKEIRRWWENHIIRLDMKYVPFIKKPE